MGTGVGARVLNPSGFIDLGRLAKMLSLVFGHRMLSRYTGPQLIGYETAFARFMTQDAYAIDWSK